MPFLVITGIEVSCFGVTQRKGYVLLDTLGCHDLRLLVINSYAAINGVSVTIDLYIINENVEYVSYRLSLWQTTVALVNET